MLFTNLKKTAFSPQQVYEPLLRASQDESLPALDELNMPTYFNFLTVMAIHTFIKEEVDVAVVEVGIGGEYDCTNVIPSPVVCGVSNLGLDHTAILGMPTLDKSFLSVGSK